MKNENVERFCLIFHAGFLTLSTFGAFKNRDETQR
jgi:hypothetical protein